MMNRENQLKQVHTFYMQNTKINTILSVCARNFLNGELLLNFLMIFLMNFLKNIVLLNVTMPLICALTNHFKVRSRKKWNSIIHLNVIKLGWLNMKLMIFKTLWLKI